MHDTRKMTRISVLVATGIALHVTEAMLPFLSILPVPGVKLGLANIVTLLALVMLGEKEAMVVVILRVTLASLLAGTFFSPAFYLSFAGGVFSGVVMVFVYKYFSSFISIIGVSIIGAVMHNLAQLAVAALLIQQAGIFMYLPFLLLFALPTGFFTGLVSALLLQTKIGREFSR